MKAAFVRNWRSEACFRPEITGKILEKQSHTEIQIELRTISFVSVFMLLWLAAATFAFVTTFIAGILGLEQIAVSVLPLGMVLLALYLWNFGFSIESETAKKELIDLLLAKIKNDS